MSDNWSPWVVAVGQMDPVRKPDGPSLVVKLIYESPVLDRHAEGGHAWYALGIRAVQRLCGARARRQRCEVRGGCVWWPGWWIWAGESLIETLGRDCERVAHMRDSVTHL